MRKKTINSIIDLVARDDGVFEVKVHPFTREEIGFFEDGLRKALKEKEENAGAILCFDFSEVDSLQDLDERALFDICQFISFNCLRQKAVHIHWGPCFLDYLKKYPSRKKEMWKLSSSTVKKLMDANCENLNFEKN
jgi:hypothetical protein